MAQYPVMLDLSNQVCLVVGGGVVALRKVNGLLSAGAKVRLVAPEVIPDLKAYAESQAIEFLEKPYESSDLEGALLAISATDDSSTNQCIAADARAQGVLVNVVDQPYLCTFTVPATLSRGELVISVATGGKSPALAAHIRVWLEERFGPEYASYIDFLGRTRQWVRDRFPDDPQKRHKANYRIVKLNLVDHFAQGRESIAEEEAKQCISSLLD
ncbi:MAG: bifunctional precorrin-2 dehydrogenase/sirohydrochlorin ferrochelatase [bacterium]